MAKKTSGERFLGESSVTLVRDEAGTPRSLVGITRVEIYLPIRGRRSLPYQA